MIAIIGKVIGCGLGAYLFGQSFWESAIIGFGMKGRGAVEMIIFVFATSVFCREKRINIGCMITNFFSKMVLRLQ